MFLELSLFSVNGLSALLNSVTSIAQIFIFTRWDQTERDQKERGWGVQSPALSSNRMWSYHFVGKSESAGLETLLHYSWIAFHLYGLPHKWPFPIIHNNSKNNDHQNNFNTPPLLTNIRPLGYSSISCFIPWPVTCFQEECQSSARRQQFSCFVLFWTSI